MVRKVKAKVKTIIRAMAVGMTSVRVRLLLGLMNGEENTGKAKLVTNKIDEMAVVERTKLQKADHTKQLLDQLNGGKPKETKKAAAAAKKAAGDDRAKETKVNKNNSELTSEEKKEK